MKQQVGTRLLIRTFCVLSKVDGNDQNVPRWSRKVSPWQGVAHLCSPHVPFGCSRLVLSHNPQMQLNTVALPTVSISAD